MKKRRREDYTTNCPECNGNGISQDITRIESDNLSTDSVEAKRNEARLNAETGKDRVESLEKEQNSEREEGQKDRDDQDAEIKSTKPSFNV